MIGTEPSTVDETASWVKILHWSAWALAACFVIAGILFGLTEFGVIEGPGPPAGTPNDYPTQLGYFLADQRVTFPYEVAASPTP